MTGGVGKGVATTAALPPRSRFTQVKPGLSLILQPSDSAHYLDQYWLLFFFFLHLKINFEQTWHAKAKRGSDVAGLIWTLLSWRLGKNWEASSLQLLFIGSSAGFSLAML